jgi:hypothetical protein
MQAMKSTLDDEIMAFVTGFNVHKNAELEAVFSDRHLEAGGIRFELFQKLFNAMEASSKHGLIFASDKVAMIDFFYPDSVRTRYIAGKVPVTIKKTRIGKLKLICIQRSNLDITIHLKNEIPLLNSPTTPALFVRLQEVWTFIYKNTFEFTLKKVVSGKDKADACTKAPVYEIEIEMLKGPATTNIANCSKSFLMKIGDLCGRFDEKGNIVKLYFTTVGVCSDLRDIQKKLIAARKRKEQRKRKKIYHESDNNKPKKNKKNQKDGLK